MKKAIGFGIAGCVLMLAPTASAEDVLANSGFELEGFGGPADSANWVEIASGAAGTLSERVEGGAASGLFAHRLVCSG